MTPREAFDRGTKTFNAHDIPKTARSFAIRTYRSAGPGVRNTAGVWE